MATNKYSEFTKIVEAMEGDFEKFYDKEVGAAGTRAVSYTHLTLPTKRIV